MIYSKDIYSFICSNPGKTTIEISDAFGADRDKLRTKLYRMSQRGLLRYETKYIRGRVCKKQAHWYRW